MEPRVITEICVSVSVIGLFYMFLKRIRSKNSERGRHGALALYFFPQYRSSRCLWLVNELGIQKKVSMKYYNPQDPDKRKVSEYKTHIHPNGTVPALQVEGRKPILESGAICVYLAHLHDKLLPNDENIDNFYNWIMIATCTLDEILEHIFLELNMKSRTPDEKFIKKQVDKFKVFGHSFSDHMESREFVCGDRFTVADCIIGYNIWWASKMLDGALLEEFPPLLKYLERLRCRPAYKQSTLD